MTSPTAIVHISGLAQFVQNEAVDSGGVLYLGKGATGRVMEAPFFRANSAATGGCFYLAKSAQVEPEPVSVPCSVALYVHASM